MSEQPNQNEAADGQSLLTDGLDVVALNDAGWAFISAWEKHTSQLMTGETFNNLKPMIDAAIRKYIEATNINYPPNGA